MEVFGMLLVALVWKGGALIIGDLLDFEGILEVWDTASLTEGVVEASEVGVFDNIKLM